MALLSSLCGVSSPLPAALVVLSRWSDVVIRLHCSIQTLNAVVAVVVFCIVAPEPRSACRLLVCSTAADRPPSRRTSTGSIKQGRSSAERALFHVEMTDGDAPAAVAPAASQALDAADAECLLDATVVAVAVDDDNDDRNTAGNDGIQRHLSRQGAERRLAYEQSHKPVPLLPSQRTKLLASTGNLPLPEDVVFAHTSV